MTNCTFYNNHVTAGNGGNGGNGNFNGGDGGDGGNGTGGGLYGAGSLTVVNCTFSNCGAVGGTNGIAGVGAFPGSDGRLGLACGGNLANLGPALILKNSIIATNLAGGGGYGTITDAGNNLSADGSLAFGTNSLKNTNPRLGPLADNGGSTKTMALLTNSLAIDAGDNAAGLPFDQRDRFRPAGLKGDLGAFELGYLLQGRILEGTNGVPNVAVSVGSQATNTDATGSYGLHVLPGTYFVTPSLAGYQFTPASPQPITVSADKTNVNFTAARIFTVSGRIAEGTNGIAGLKVIAGTNAATTDANGNYTFPDLRAGTYTVTPSLACYLFNPTSRSVTVGPNITALDFGGIRNDVFVLRGRILEGANGLGGVAVSAGTKTNITEANGNFTLSGLCPGTNTVTPFKIGYGFNPKGYTVVVTQDEANLDFIAGPIISSITRLTNGAVQLALYAPTGQINRIEASTNLIHWVDIFTNAAPFQFQDDAATNFPVRFYRSARPQ